MCGLSGISLFQKKIKQFLPLLFRQQGQCHKTVAISLLRFFVYDKVYFKCSQFLNYILGKVCMLYKTMEVGFQQLKK